MKDNNINILATGSRGNCVILFNKFIIDVGISQKDITKYMKCDKPNIKHALITHSHSDHYRTNIISYLNKKYNIKTIIPTIDIKNFHNLHEVKHCIKRYDIDKPILLDKYNIEMYPLQHGILTTVCYVFTDICGVKTLYATDFEDINQLPDEYFDNIYIEGNYDERKAREIFQKGSREEINRVKMNFRHCSVQKAMSYIRTHLKTGGRYILLHPSSQFL